MIIQNLTKRLIQNNLKKRLFQDEYFKTTISKTTISKRLFQNDYFNCLQNSITLFIDNFVGYLIIYVEKFTNAFGSLYFQRLQRRHFEHCN